jgi:tetratricopeptide (TPR) repeat protein
MIRAVLAGAVLAAAFCPAQSVTQADLDGLRQLFRAGERAEAERSAAALIDRAGNQLPALLALGQVLGVEKAFPLSERAFVRAAEAAPGSYEAQFNLGFTRFQMQNPAAAVEPLERASALKPDSFDAAYLLGVTLSEAGRKTDAIRRLRAARRLNPKHAGTLSLLGVLYTQEGYPLDAMETLEEARRVDPSRLPVWLALVEASHAAFEFQKALEAAAQAVSRFPESADAHFRLGFELETAGKFDEARAEFERAIERQADHPEARLALGRMELRAGRRADAMRHFEAVLARYPGNALARIELAKALVGLREMERAKALLLDSALSDPTRHLLLAQIYQAEGKPRESAVERQRFLDLTAEQKPGGMAGQAAGPKLRRFEP